MAVKFFQPSHSIRYTQNAPVMDGHTALTVGVNFKTLAAVNNGYIWSFWNYFDWGSIFTIKVEGSNILFAMHGTGGYRMRITTHSPLLPLTQYRIICRWTAAGVMEIHINGVACPIAVFGGYNATISVTGPAVSESLTLGIINIPVSGETPAYGEICDAAVWTTDIGAVAANVITGPETLTTPKSSLHFLTGLIFFAPLCRSMYPDSAYPDPNISDIIGVPPCNSLLAGLSPQPAMNVPHPWVYYPPSGPYASFYCPVTFTGASCSGGVVPVLANPPGGVEFHGLGPHHDRVFLELDLD